MRGYRIFLKKELVEAYKTYKLLIMGAVFLIFGIISPLTAKMMPDIMKWVMESDPSTAAMDLSRLFTDPKALDAWAQFYSNIGQMGLIVFVIVFSGMLSSELSKGTLTIILTKGLSRSAAILSKLTSAVLIWTGSYAIAFFASWGYTAYFFPGGKLPDLLFAGLCLWVFGVFLLAVTTLAAVLTKTSSIFCMLAVGAAVIALNLLNIVPKIGKYNPAALTGAPMKLLAEAVTPRGVYPALAVAVIGIIALTLFAVMLFNQRKSTKKKAVLAFSLVFFLILTAFIGEEVPAQIKLSRYAVSEKVTIGAGTEWELAGLLTIPKNSERKVPAVVLVHGSGSNDMDETIYDNKPFRDIAEYLSSNGIAVIRYNKRTYTHGKKISDQADGGFTVWDETIEDALIATEMLKSDPRIDENRVFILGHSLGGMLAPRIHAMGGDYAGLILFAGSPRFLLDIMKDQQSAYLKTLEDGEEKADILAENERFINSVETALRLPDEEAKNRVLDGMNGVSAYYFKDMYENSAAEYIKDISAPFLIMHAAEDLQVYTDKDFELYKELFAGRPNVTFLLFDGLNHLFMPSGTDSIAEILDEYGVKANVDMQVLRDIEEWIKAN